MRIALLDSGIGGLTVLREALSQLPDEDYIYYADTANVPYGTKPKEIVRSSLLKAAEHLSTLGIKALVIACNTATSIAVQALRERYSFPIIGMEPAVKPAVERNRSLRKRVLVTATALTLQEGKYHDLVVKTGGEMIVDSLPLPELVNYCEQLEFRSDIILPYFRDKLAPYNLEHYGAIVLGCTHFPYYRGHLRSVVPEHIELIDGSVGTVNRLKHMLVSNGTRGGGTGDIQFLSSLPGSEEQERLKRALSILNLGTYAAQG